MKTPRELNELENVEIDLTDYGYHFAFIVDGIVKYVTGTGELFARVLLDSDQIIPIEKDQFSIGDVYIPE